MKNPRHLLAAIATVLALAAVSASAAPAPAGTKALLDLAYVTNPHPLQKLDLYLPEKAGQPVPLILWIHGGGWRSGDKAGGGALVKGDYAQRGYALASMNYRLSGDSKFPAMIEDCKSAIRWLRAHAKEYNIDPTRIGVWGPSAGGHLVALLGATGNIRDFDVGENLDQSSAVQAVCDFYGPNDLLYEATHNEANGRAKGNYKETDSAYYQMLGGSFHEKPYQDLLIRANPIPYLTKKVPPYLIVQGDSDALVSYHQAELLYAALQANGTPVHFHTIRGGGHGRGFDGKELSDLVAAFFDYRLLGKETAAAKWPLATTSESPSTEIRKKRPGPAARPGTAEND